MNEMIENFQFIRPAWLWALLAVVIVYALKLKFGKNQNVWQQIIPEHLYQKMIVVKGLARSNKFIHLSAAAMLVGILAIAGPTWEKLPQAVYQTQMGKVILIDMSMSMRATDLSPDRLTRARFKAIDLINEVKEGETGLVAYAGDAFVVSPLTDDVNNLKTLIPVLAPEIMPTQGSVALSGLLQAAELLGNAGYQQGQIYWITDGIRIDEIEEVRDFITTSPFDISALLIGTELGAPITMQDGQLLKDYSGKIVVPSINSRYMNQAMSGTNAVFQLFANDNSDIQSIKRKSDFEQRQQSTEVENTTGDTFKDMGPYLVLLLLPIAAYSFRKGVLSIALAGIFTLSIGTTSPNALAIQEQANQSPTLANSPQTLPNETRADSGSLFNSVFKNANQRGKLAYDNQDFATAQSLFKSDAWQAASAYKNKDYEQAARIYERLIERQKGDLPNNWYNKGNALAKQGLLKEALNAYDQALLSKPDHAQAIANKSIIEELLEQQQENQDQQQDPSEQSSQDDNDKQKNEDSQDGGSQENSSQKDGEQSQSDQQQDGEQQDSEEQNAEQQQSDEKSASEQSKQQQEAKNDEALKQNAQQEQSQQEQSDQQSVDEPAEKDNTGQNNNEQQEQQAAISNQVNMDELTPEEKEELQRMQMILNKIPDDPAYLLKRKMQLEAYKRKNNPPPPERENW
jgi:Ca-activated chloride channel family protein